jgi:NlpC/P60 family protein
MINGRGTRNLARALFVVLIAGGFTGLTIGPAAAADTTFNEVNFYSGGVYVGTRYNSPHWWGACYVQDFNGGPWGHFLRVATDPGKPIYVVRTGMWEGWGKYGAATGSLKCPTGNEYPYAGGARQNFEGGTLLWRNSMAAVKVTARAANAVGWAWNRIGATKTSSGAWWAWKCETFVENAYGTSGRYATALAHYRAVKANIHTSGTPPPGAMVFYNLTQWGHVGISVGGGYVISTQTPNGAAVKKHTVGYFSNYLGWASPGF